MLRTTLALLLLCSSFAHASTIYKYVDKDGHVTFTNIPISGAQPIMINPAQRSAPQPSGNKARPGQARPTPANMPQIDSSTQHSRDQGRRRILQTELNNEQRALDDARQARDDYAKKPGATAAQQQRLRDAVTDRERNIAALKQELGNAGTK